MVETYMKRIRICRCEDDVEMDTADVRIGIWMDGLDIYAAYDIALSVWASDHGENVDEFYYEEVHDGRRDTY